MVDNRKIVSPRIITIVIASKIWNVFGWNRVCEEDIGCCCLEVDSGACWLRLSIKFNIA